MLRQQSDISEVNFWAPSAMTFRELQPGEMFLFKLHALRPGAAAQEGLFVLIQ